MDSIQIREMKAEDYDKVYGLWKRIRGLGLRSIDDSREGVERFLIRNPGCSVVAEEEGNIVGAVLCGHDGRRGCLYHVCVAEEYRHRGIGRRMVSYCAEALRREHINKISLIAFVRNLGGNAFWQSMGWCGREDIHYYDFTLNEENMTVFNQ